ncbi:hypothetical protein NHX12_027554 [Muraenolepis orangiensis]|uniref:Ig-like domain-containing protein n=1 Tax=Muraenolepis orangiensis TaxID=630683 RepID=A0A9Q0EH66_9TELE|nr:hypothetical protein NHX12_027554 [Muraenolepis orangiensis]
MVVMDGCCGDVAPRQHDVVVGGQVTGGQVTGGDWRSGQPVEFLPRVGVGFGLDGRIAITIACVSHAVPDALVTWLREGGQAVTSSNQHQISAKTTLLTVRHFNVSQFLRDWFTCTCANPLGRKARTTRLLGTVVSEDYWSW